jgi:hypothetical protein
VDENTVLVCAILGTTYTGQYEDVKEMDRLIGEKNQKERLSVYIHVDAASGGFVAPFANPDLVWDFRLVSISLVRVLRLRLTSYSPTFALSTSVDTNVRSMLVVWQVHPN